jgi:hypothetical protein
MEEMMPSPVAYQTEVIDELEEKLAEEKDRRVYYQDIVYAVCNHLPRGIVCGTKYSPTTGVQDAVKALRDGLREAILYLREEQVDDSIIEHLEGKLKRQHDSQSSLPEELVNHQIKVENLRMNPRIEHVLASDYKAVDSEGQMFFKKLVLEIIITFPSGELSHSYVVTSGTAHGKSYRSSYLSLSYAIEQYNYL